MVVVVEKNKKTMELKMVFLGYKVIGKTSIIEAIKGNKNIKNFESYKKTL